MKKIMLLVLFIIILAGCGQKVNALTLEEAQEIALKEVAGKVLKAKEDRDDGVSYYDFTIITDTEKYEVEIDANSGKVLKTEKDDDYIGTNSNSVDGTVTPNEPTNTSITIEQAQQIALERVGEGYLTKSELDYDDDNGIKKYEIEIKNGNKEYEIEVNADTGEIIKYEEDND
ncbi:MAG: PepSY domain-containing protein [Thomasclavelia sp.]|uniref:PepSY domain-containing protein n=1 Tax=Thomasclavelia sp. TaxID=3025757 RepID=UPI00399F0930